MSVAVCFLFVPHTANILWMAIKISHIVANALFPNKRQQQLHFGWQLGVLSFAVIVVAVVAVTVLLLVVMCA